MACYSFNVKEREEGMGRRIKTVPTRMKESGSACEIRERN
jgi:hypothetical protein